MQEHSVGCAIALGYLVSLGSGTIVTFLFHRLTTRLEDKSRSGTADEKSILRWGWSSIITGLVERLIFTPFVVVSLESAVQAMGGWLALKMAATWQRDRPVEVGQLYWINRAFLGLQTGFLSLSFAMAGGLLSRYLLGIRDFPIGTVVGGGP